MADNLAKNIKQKQAEDLLGEFRRSAEAISARVYETRDCSGAFGIIAGLISERGFKKIAASSSPIVRELKLDSLPGGTQVFFEDLRLHAASADMGISGADYAIAETGTLVQDATDIGSRLVSTLPPVHVVLVDAGALVANLGEALSLYGCGDGRAFPAYLSFISGPSRTADIERILTIGVHGPAELHIIFVGPPGGDGK